MAWARARLRDLGSGFAEEMGAESELRFRAGPVLSLCTRPVFLVAGARDLQNPEPSLRGAEGARGVASRSSRGGYLTVSSGMGTLGFLLASLHQGRSGLYS